MAEIWDAVAPSKDFKTKYPEIFHYTTKTGLQGIINSNALWASYFEQLNDSSEIKHLRGPLTRAVMSRCMDLIRSKYPDLAANDVAMVSNALGLARRFVGQLYQDTYDHLDLKYRPAPFIASFCTHDDGSYESKNGLLSQWRGYAGADGFCIVFDTEKICDLMEEEWRHRSHFFLSIDAVRYAEEDIDIRSQANELVRAAENSVFEFCDNKTIARSAMVQFFVYSSLFKHIGFREEREVRIVAIPVPVGGKHLDRREIVSFIDIRGPTARRRFLPLFGFDDHAIPIKRIIVGPSRNQNDGVSFVRYLVSKSVEVVRSATPWLPPSK